MVDYGTTDRFTGGTPSVDSANGGFGAANAVDNNASTYWQSAFSALPHYFIYDFGAGATWKISKVTIKPYGSGFGGKDFTVQGSNGSYSTLYTGQCSNDSNVQTFTFTNKTAYRYIKINFSSTYETGSNSVAIYEFEAFEGIYPPEGGSFLFNLI